MKKRAHFVLLKLISVVLAVVETFLLLRLALKLFGASTAAPFVAWLFETSRPLIAPFEGAFPSPALQGGVVLEFSTLFAILIYALIAWLLEELIGLIYQGARERPEDRRSG